MIEAGIVLGFGLHLEPAASSLERGRPGVMNPVSRDRFPDDPAFGLAPVDRQERQNLRLFAGAQDGFFGVELKFPVVEDGFSLQVACDQQWRAAMCRGGSWVCRPVFPERQRRAAVRAGQVREAAVCTGPCHRW